MYDPDARPDCRAVYFQRFECHQWEFRCTSGWNPSGHFYCFLRLLHLEIICSCPFSSESHQQSPEPGVSTLGSRTNPDTGSKPSKAECAAHSGLQSGLSYIDLCGEAHMRFVDTHTPKHTQSLPTAFTFFLKFHIRRMQDFKCSKKQKFKRKQEMTLNLKYMHVIAIFYLK